MDVSTLLLVGLSAVAEPILVAVAATGFEEIAEASPFGRQGTFIVGLVVAVLSAVGVVLARRGGSGAVRSTMAILLGASAGLIALMAFAFLFAGGIAIVFAVLLFHALFSIGMLIRGILQNRPTAEGR